MPPAVAERALTHCQRCSSAVSRAVVGGWVPVGHQPGVEGLFGGGQLAAGGLQLRLLGLQCCQLLRGQRVFGSLLGLQCADGGLGSGRRLLGLRRLRFQ